MNKSQKPYKGPAMEGRVARWYASNTQDDGRFQRSAEALMADLGPGASVLEVAPGPGYLAIALARGAGIRVSALDISRTFVEIARDKARSAGVTVDFQQGNASAMPYPDGSFDLVVCQAAFKNFSDPLGAISEMHRVLRPGGHAVIQDLRKEATMREIKTEVAAMNLSWFNAFRTRMTFRWFLLKNAYSEEALRELVERSQFRSGERRPDGIGFELRLVKECVVPG